MGNFFTNSQIHGFTLKNWVKYLAVVGIWMFVVSSGSAQKQPKFTTQSKKALEYYIASEPLYLRRQYWQAIELLDKALRKDQNFVEAHMRIGTCYRKINDLDKAAFHYNHALNANVDKALTAAAYISLGDIYFKKGNYQASIENLENYLALNTNNEKAIQKSRQILVNAQFAAEKVKSPIEFNSIPLPANINQFALQYFPVLTVDQNTLIFTGRAGYTPDYDEDIFVCHRISDTLWTSPKSISNRINTYNNEGTCTISADGKMLIFTACQGRQVFGSCDLFVSYKLGDIWSTPQNMGSTINSASWESQPSLSSDGRTLYFVSNRKGGYGMRDIWQTKFNEKSGWSVPVNLGKDINTPMDEVSPFIHVNNQTLFFSSNGYPGFGGLDIYYAERKNEGWSTPENIGYPLNTTDDQVSLFITGDGKKGYYSFEKVHDLYFRQSLLFEFDVPPEIKISHKSNFVAGRVFDSNTRTVLSAKIELFDINRDTLISRVRSDKINGEYYMVLTEGAEYALYASKKGYLFKSMAFDYVKSSTLEPVYIDIYLDPIEIGSISTLNNIFFDFDKYEIKEKSNTELGKVLIFLQTNPQSRIEIGGHTDNVGSADYNLNLSLKRAEAVYKYLTATGINAQRLQYQGYGQENPIVSNDTPQNQQLNRRIEFKILN